MNPTKIDMQEFRLMRDYIEKNCGIHITEDKMYLVETRLTSLMVENGCTSFVQFYNKAINDHTKVLENKIMDVMTTNETLWFRDKTPFETLSEVLLKELTADIISGRKSKIRIWCAACSTGQEPYSIAMTIKEFIDKNRGLSESNFEIVGSDLSPTVLYLAMAGRYDNLAMTRGMDPYFKDKYFTQTGKVWAIDPSVKKMVTFKKLNLQNSYSIIGKVDVVFCRNVMIYFSDDFKKSILQKIQELLKPSGYLFIGASESIINYSKEFKMHRHKRGMYYQVNNG